jgi:hypothetical protein
MKTLTVKQAEAYITENYGSPRHNVEALVKACRAVAKEYKLNAVKLFHLLIENEPMTGTHSYGFHTAYGRNLIETIQSNYYKFN